MLFQRCLLFSILITYVNHFCNWFHWYRFVRHRPNNPYSFITSSEKNHMWLCFEHGGYKNLTSVTYSVIFHVTCVTVFLGWYKSILGKVLAPVAGFCFRVFKLLTSVFVQYICFCLYSLLQYLNRKFFSRTILRGSNNATFYLDASCLYEFYIRRHSHLR